MRNKAKRFFIALVLIIAAILILVFYSKSTNAKVANNFREDYLKISGTLKYRVGVGTL